METKPLNATIVEVNSEVKNMARNVLAAFLIFSCLLHGGNAVGKIDPRLTQRLLFGSKGGNQTENVMVSFTGGIRSVLDRINRLNLTSLAKKRDALVSAQKTLAETVQAGLKRVLNSMGIQYKSFWISNSVIVPNVDSRIVKIISKIPGVAKVEKEPEIKIEPVRREAFEDFGNITRARRESESLQWGIKKIAADWVWEGEKITGKRVVVAGIDTGVRHTHYLLEKNWRRDYGWYDPYDKTPLPNDDDGHGTHTMGTIVGSDGFGVAPGATWIACKGCLTTHCGASELLACGQWVLCPTKPDGSAKDCNRAPDIVSNSWGGPGGDRWYDDVIASWQSIGIIPVFSNGNRGPSCGTVGSPGDSPDVISVGSTDSDDDISYFSSLGPTKDGRIKPDFTAPGGNIKSASHESDTALTTLSGTSMACPHVSGTIALMLEKKGTATYEEVYESLAKSASKYRDYSPKKTCGSNKETYEFPNNVYGHGIIDADFAVRFE